MKHEHLSKQVQQVNYIFHCRRPFCHLLLTNRNNGQFRSRAGSAFYGDYDHSVTKH